MDIIEVSDSDVRLSKVGDLVHEAMMVQHKATLNGEPHSPLTVQTADDIIHKIIAIFE